MADYLVQYGEVIGYALVGVLALGGLGIVQLIRRRRDLSRARVSVRLATYSISEPRLGPIAISGNYRESRSERWIDCGGQRAALDGGIDVVRGTRGRWHGGARTYSVRDGDEVIAIGVMSKHPGGNGAAWRLVSSPGEAGIQLFARKPAAAPPPLWPWRALLTLTMCGGIVFAGLYEIGSTLLDVGRDTTCTESSRWRFQIAAALPLVREDALVRLERCRNLAQ